MHCTPVWDSVLFSIFLENYFIYEPNENVQIVSLLMQLFSGIRTTSPRNSFLRRSHTTKGKQDGKKVIANDNSKPTWHASSTDSETELLVQLPNMHLSHLFAYFFRPETFLQVVLPMSQCSTPLWWPGIQVLPRKTLGIVITVEIWTPVEGDWDQFQILGSCITVSAGLKSSTLRWSTWAPQNLNIHIPSQVARLPTECAGNHIW